MRRLLAVGLWCDYRGPQDVSCRNFIIVFQQITTPGVADPHRVGVAFGTLEWPTGPEADWYMAGMHGAWALTLRRSHAVSPDRGDGTPAGG